MARKRLELTESQTARLADGVRRGETAEQVATALGGGLGPRTVARRMRELRGPVAQSRGSSRRAEAPASTPVLASGASPMPAVDAAALEPPPGATREELHRLLGRAKAAIEEAERVGNLPLVGQMIRVTAMLSETIRKSTPAPTPNPEDDLDMIAARERGRKELLRLVAQVVV